MYSMLTRDKNAKSNMVFFPLRMCSTDGSSSCEVCNGKHEWRSLSCRPPSPFSHAGTHPSHSRDCYRVPNRPAFSDHRTHRQRQRTPQRQYIKLEQEVMSKSNGRIGRRRSRRYRSAAEQTRAVTELRCCGDVVITLTSTSY